MYRRRFIIFILLATVAIFSDDIEIGSIEFEAIKISELKSSIDTSEIYQKYNIAYSSILPEGAIYSITDKITGLEAVIQIGYSSADSHPKNIYITDNLYDFFAKNYEKKPDKIGLSIRFAGWNQESDGSVYANIEELVVNPENSPSEIQKNESDKYFIQLGSFSYYQNAYPQISNMLPVMLKKPKFYLIKKNIMKDGKKTEIYRVLAGPYSFSEARSISEEVNTKYNASVFFQSRDRALSDINGEDGAK
ncbi:MAG: SPOR domain-containing protein [Spirochaetes bacterium]|nr:SPOR domain-containing protein [Spirochaetota bacterium]